MENKKKEDSVAVLVLILFMVSLFGHSLQRMWRPKEKPYARLGYSEKEGKEMAGMFWFEETGTTTRKKTDKKKKVKKNATQVTVTRYSPDKSQCDNDPLVTADLSEINLKKLRRRQIKWVAISQDLLTKYQYGDKLKLTCSEDPSINGIYEVHDCINKRFRNRVDILTHSDNNQGQGLWENVQVAKL